MKKYLFLQLVFLFPLFIFCQSVEVIGSLKINQMDTVNETDLLVVKTADGTLGVKELSSLFSPETDPIFISSPSFSIMNGDILNWSNAYNLLNNALYSPPEWDLSYQWGDHSNAGYIEAVNRDLQQITSTAISSTASSSFTDMSGMTLTSVNSGEYLVHFNAEMSSSSNNRMEFIINIDGLDQQPTKRELWAPSYTDFVPVSIVFKTEVLTPNEVIKIKWRSDSGSVYVRNRILIIDNQ